MSYLKFDKSRIVNLEYSLAREILRTNRRGAYHYTTLVECNTRKQHGLLVMPIPDLDDSNHVILSSFDETIIQHGAEFNLGIHKYDGNNYSPMGHKYIREFDCESGPKTTYRVGGVILSKEKLFSLKDNNIMIRYKLLDVHSPTTLRFRPFLAFREINSLTFENNSANRSYKEIENGISTCMYEGYPELFMQFNKKVKFVFDPVWYKGIEYLEDMKEGLPYKEDLYVPGYFELPIKKGETIIFSAGDKITSPRTLSQNFEKTLADRTPRSSFYNCLKNSAHQFFFRPNDKELYLLEGYPWFKVNARMQFATLPGLTLAAGREKAFEEVMDTAMPHLQRFLEGKPTNSYMEGLNAPDVFLWIAWALGKFSKKHKETCYTKYGQLVFDIVEYIIGSKHSNLKPHSNGLVYSNGVNQPISLMNAMSFGRPIVPRTGYLVDHNALWYNTLMFSADIAKDTNQKKLNERFTKLAAKVKESYNDTFVNEHGYLYDYVDGNIKNLSVRPNMILAVAVDHSPLDRKISKSVIDIVTKELLTPKGLRTLSPKSEGYCPYYAGNQHEKDYASMNGTANPGFLGAYIEACMKILHRGALFYAERVLVSLEEEMGNNCIGTLSQFYDGNPPYSGHGAPSMAIHVASILRIMDMIKEYEEETQNNI